MMSGVKRFSAACFCRVGLSFGRDDSDLLVCGLLYILGSLSFPPKSPPPHRLLLRRHEAFILSSRIASVL